MISHPRLRTIAIIALALCTAARALALKPDEIALVVNGKVPEGRALAEFYAQQRHIPDGRIIELDLDPGSVISPAEEMPFADYQPKVAQPIREFLQKNHLDDKVKCLVTLWGVPLRIGNRVLSASEKQELETIQKELAQTRSAMAQQVMALEQVAVQLHPSFAPDRGMDIEQLARRLDVAGSVIVGSLRSVPDSSARGARFMQLISTVERVAGSPRALQLMAKPELGWLAPRPPTSQQTGRASAQLQDVQKQLAALDTYDPIAADREKSRQLSRANLGLFGYASVLTGQLQALEPQDTASALDSELALLWWKQYTKYRWLPNPLNWHYQLELRRRNAYTALTLMVTRLDGPSVQIVHDLIANSVKAEEQGISGQVALDARGRKGMDEFGKYDQGIRDLAELLQSKTKLQVTLENTEALIPAHSMKDIGLYCGWYSLRNYAPPGSFVPGAVGYHIASFEMVSLRAPNEHGWVRGLLSDGVCGTIGSVAEPYLHSFPMPDEFFPLLLTGKLTLAEVYWRTTPLVSWMQDCIGDPLYTPYQRDPPLKVEDLPGELRSALEPTATSRPTTGPTTTQPITP